MAPKLDRFHDYRKGIRYNFIPIPMILIYDEAYRSMSAYAKILYSLILNRMHLSERNHWEDEQGVFVKYSTQEICEDLQCSDRSALKYRKELVDYGLIDVQVMGQGKESKIYPYDFAEPLPEQEEIEPEKESIPSPMRNSKSDIAANHTEEEQHTLPDKTDTDTSESEPFETEMSRDYTENADRKNISCLDRKNLPIKNGKIFRSKSEKSSDLERKNFPAEKEYLEKDNNNIYHPSIHQETQIVSPGEKKSMDGLIDEKQTFEQQIKENLSIDEMKQWTDWLDLKLYLELYQLIIDSCQTSSPTIRIGGEDYPTEKVRKRFLELNSFHLDYVIDTMKHTTTKIRNIRNYLLTVLYRAPQTITSYYQAEVNHDFYGPEKPRAKNEPGLSSPSYTDEEIADLERKLLNS